MSIHNIIAGYNPLVPASPTFHLACRTRHSVGPYRDAHEISGEPPTHLLLTSRSDSLRLTLDADTLALTAAATPGIWHYFRLADATLKPLPPDPDPIPFAAGDTYIAFTPGARRIADSPAIARFLHLRDDFNAEKLADALLDHLVELAGLAKWPADVTVLVVEAR